MHARELVELAALVARHGPAFVRQAGPIPARGIEQYWTASKCRLDRWGRALKAISNRAEHGEADSSRRESIQVQALLEEILASEILVRVWTAVLSAHDRRRGTDLAEPVARSVLIGHLEARHRVLILMVNGRGIRVEEAVKLNHLRRRTERWSDLLIGHLSQVDDMSQFAVDPQRARDFADDLRRQQRQGGQRAVWPLVQASLQAAFGQGLAPASPNPDLNRAVAAAILSCLPPEVFDGTGVFRSLWLVRLSSITEDAQGMIEELLGPQGPAASRNRRGPGPGDQPNRLRRFRP